MHPAVHAGILSQDTEKDKKDMTERGYSNIDLVLTNLTKVACNLYPFESTIAKSDVTLAMAVEEVDIGTT